MRLSLLLLAFVLPVAAGAQAPHAAPSEAFVEQAAPGPTEAGGVERIYTQLWTEERALLEQFLADSDGQPGSFALIRQEGTDHTALIEQRGTRNAAVLLQDGVALATEVQQTGIGHLYGGRLTGADATVRVIQGGARNAYLMDLDLTPRPGAQPDHTIVQEGVGLRVVQTGTTSTPFTVEQHGLGQTILIEHNGGR